MVVVGGGAGAIVNGGVVVTGGVVTTGSPSKIRKSKYKTFLKKI
jgi:hypothetical protein